MTVISVTNLALRFGTATVLEDISFALDEHDKLGVIGVNGCGKSSLHRIPLSLAAATASEADIPASPMARNRGATCSTVSPSATYSAGVASETASCAPWLSSDSGEKI